MIISLRVNPRFHTDHTKLALPSENTARPSRVDVSMKKTLLTLFLICTTLILSAQSYNTTFGMRLGTDWGLTVKHRVASNTTLEGILQSSLQREEAIVTLMGAQHLPFITRRLNVYTGGGLHKGWGGVALDRDGEAYKNPFGISLIGGIELTLARLNVTYDFKPAINLVGGERTVYLQTGISVRYVIIERDRKDNKRIRQRKRKRRRRNNDGFNWRFWENW